MGAPHAPSSACPLPLPSLLSMIEKATGGLTFEMTPVDVYFVAERACASTPAPGPTHHLTVLAIGCTCCATRPSMKVQTLEDYMSGSHTTQW